MRYLSGSSDQNVNWTQVVSEAADEVKHAQIKIFCVKIGEAVLQDKASIASDTSLVFSQLNIAGMLKALNDLSAEACSNGEFIVWVSCGLWSSWYINCIVHEGEEI